MARSAYRPLVEVLHSPHVVVEHVLEGVVHEAAGERGGAGGGGRQRAIGWMGRNRTQQNGSLKGAA